MWEKMKLTPLLFIVGKAETEGGTNVSGGQGNQLSDPVDPSFLDSTPPVEDPFRSFSYFEPTHDPEEFNSDDFENVSANMVNVRDVIMYDIETGVEGSHNDCGHWGCIYEDYNYVYGAINAVNGNRLNQGRIYESWSTNSDGYA